MRNRFGFLELIVFLVGVSVEAPALTTIELQDHASRAQQFLCSKTFCLKQLPEVRLTETKYYAHFECGSFVDLRLDTDKIAAQVNLVHEFTHAYRCAFNKNETHWLNEGLAKLMEYHYTRIRPLSYLQRLKTSPEISFGNTKAPYFAVEGIGYPSSFWLLLYLYNRFGAEKFLQKVLRSPRSGWDNVITSIHELIQETHLPMPHDLITVEQILRHFAVALWINDAFPAKYSLFQIDGWFEPLAKLAPMPVTSAQQVTGGNLLPGETRITYSNRYHSTQASEVYSLLSYQPLELKEAHPSDKALVFIYIFRAP